MTLKHWMHDGKTEKNTFVFVEIRNILVLNWQIDWRMNVLKEEEDVIKTAKD